MIRTKLLTEKFIRHADALKQRNLKGTRELMEQYPSALFDQPARGEITQEQDDALQREIAETGQALRSLESQASAPNAVLDENEEVGGRFKQVGDSIANSGSTLTKTVTAPVLGIGAAAVKTTADFDTEMSKIPSICGMTGMTCRILRYRARKMGSKIRFSASSDSSGE